MTITQTVEQAADAPAKTRVRHAQCRTCGFVPCGSAPRPNPGPYRHEPTFKPSLCAVCWDLQYAVGYTQSTHPCTAVRDA